MRTKKQTKNAVAFTLMALFAIFALAFTACGDGSGDGNGGTGGTPQPGVYIGTDSDGSTYELIIDDTAEGSTYTLVITQTDGTVITSTGTIKAINSSSITLQPSVGSSGAFTVAVQGGDTISSITGNITDNNGSTIQTPKIEIPDAMWGTWRIFAHPDSEEGRGHQSTVSVASNNGTLSMSGSLRPIFINDQWGGYNEAWVTVSVLPNAENLRALREGTTISFKARGDGQTYRLVALTSDVHDYAWHHYLFTPTATEQTYEIAINGTNFAQRQNWGTKVSFLQEHITHIDWQISQENYSGSVARNYSLSVRDFVITVPGEGGTGGGGYTFDYELGATGPGGGKIFYRSAEGFTVYQNATDTVGITCHYLEAAPVDMSAGLFTGGKLIWADTTSYINSTMTLIGRGRKNTALILATYANAPAAKACDEYSNNGKDDWFLPSKDELNELYKSKDSVGNLKTTVENSNYPYYWSSSQSNTGNMYAWAQNFFNGNQSNSSYKTSSDFVRAVRAF